MSVMLVVQDKEVILLQLSSFMAGIYTKIYDCVIKTDKD